MCTKTSFELSPCNLSTFSASYQILKLYFANCVAVIFGFKDSFVEDYRTLTIVRKDILSTLPLDKTIKHNTCFILFILSCDVRSFFITYYAVTAVQFDRISEQELIGQNAD